MFRQAIRRTRDGDFELRLSSEERELLRRLPVELSSLLEEAPSDPSLRRLFPPAYNGDADAEAEYRHLMHGELLGKHREALVVLQETTDRDRLRSDEAHAWLTALNDLRLVLGTRLGVTEELYDNGLDPDDPEAAGLGVYLYLTALQEQLVQALASGRSS